MKQWLLIFAGIGIFGFAGTETGFAQKKGAVVKSEIRKQQKENAKAIKRANKYGAKRHLSIQDKATRKRMKRNIKNSNRYARGGKRKGL